MTLEEKIARLRDMISNQGATVEMCLLMGDICGDAVKFKKRAMDNHVIASHLLLSLGGEHKIAMRDRIKLAPSQIHVWEDPGTESLNFKIKQP